MLVYKYLPLRELIMTISVLSKSTRSSLQNSHIINENRVWICNYWMAGRYCKREYLLKENNMDE